MWTLCQERVVQLKKGLSTEMTLYTEMKEMERRSNYGLDKVCVRPKDRKAGGHIQETDLRPVCAELGETGEML